MQELKIQVFSDVILYRWASSARRFARSQRLLLQGQAISRRMKCYIQLCFVSSLHFEFKTNQMSFPSHLKCQPIFILFIYLLNGINSENIADSRTPCIPNVKQEVQSLRLKSATSFCAISRNLKYPKR
jgi:hypothetical protein